MELIEPKAPLFAYGCWGALYKYLNTIQYNRDNDDRDNDVDDYNNNDDVHACDDDKLGVEPIRDIGP